MLTYKRPLVIVIHEVNQLSCMATKLTGFLEHLTEATIPESPHLAHHIVGDTVCHDHNTQTIPQTCDQSTKTFSWHWTCMASQSTQSESSSDDSLSDTTSPPNSPVTPLAPSPGFVPSPAPEYSSPASPTDYSPTSPQPPELPSSTTDSTE